MRRTIIFIFSALMLIPCISYAGDMNKEVGIVAHRGFWNCKEAGYAKNSIAALRCAQEAGFWGSEFDVNMTADSVLLVYHDSDIRGKKIEKHPYSEFANDTLANGERIPTIDQYLEQGAKYPETMLVYELKGHSSDEVEDLFVDLSIAKLEEHGLLHPMKVMFISFSLHMCEVLARKLPEFTVQFLGSSKSPEDLAQMGIYGVDYNHGVFLLHGSWHAQAQSRYMSINSWTVNSKGDMKRILEMGVDQITTDNPLEARELIKEMNITELR